MWPWISNMNLRRTSSDNSFCSTHHYPPKSVWFMLGTFSSHIPMFASTKWRVYQTLTYNALQLDGVLPYRASSRKFTMFNVKNVTVDMLSLHSIVQDRSPRPPVTHVQFDSIYTISLDDISRTPTPHLLPEPFQSNSSTICFEFQSSLNLFTTVSWLHRSSSDPRWSWTAFAVICVSRPVDH